MTFDRRIAFVLVATFALLSAAAAQQTAPSCPDIGELDVEALLLPPPCDSCAITQAELAELRSLQRARTPAMIAHARADYRVRLGPNGSARSSGVRPKTWMAGT